MFNALFSLFASHVKETRDFTGLLCVTHSWVELLLQKPVKSTSKHAHARSIQTKRMPISMYMHLNIWQVVHVESWDCIRGPYVPLFALIENIWLQHALFFFRLSSYTFNRLCMLLLFWSDSDNVEQHSKGRHGKVTCLSATIIRFGVATY